MTYVTTSLRKARKAIQNGQADGIAQAIALLVDAQPDVDPDNQTWDSAIAMLRIFEANVRTSAA